MAALCFGAIINEIIGSTFIISIKKLSKRIHPASTDANGFVLNFTTENITAIGKNEQA